MTDRLFSLKGKRALVTGGSGGLGLAIADALSRHGADVAIIGRDVNRLNEAYRRLDRQGTQGWTFPFDLHRVEGIEDLYREITEATGGIDILVNSAGINRRGAAEQITLDVWQEVIRVNLTAPFALSQAFARERIASNRPGKIINIGSLMCVAARPTVAPYGASKGGLLQLTKALAVDWAKYNITVNAIGPGYFVTEMTKPLKEDAEFDSWVLSNIPLGRWGVPDDLTGATVFLASPASDYITGQIIFVDGGWLANL